MKRVMIGTAGHIDHGKTSLVERLTGVDPTRHPEARARGMTIDIGFVPLFVEADLVAGLVDVPGHERFIRNMVAGATGIDGVLFVVAADDGVMPQTLEHLQILRLLGIQRGVVAITKADLAGPEGVELARADVETALHGTFLADAPMLVVSTKTGEGIDALKAALRAEVDRVTPKSAEGVFRLPVQRVFSLKGFGTVVTGIPFSGRVRVGDPVEAVLAARQGRVRGIQAYGQAAQEAQAGHSVSLNLTEIPHEMIRRGDVIAAPGFLRAVRRIEARFRYLPTAARPLRDLAAVRFLTGTAEVCGRMVLVDADRIEPGGEGFVQLRLDEPVAALPGDRYILRLESPELTLGGGTVVGISDKRLRRSRKDVTERLSDQERNLADPKARVLSVLTASRETMEAAELARQCACSPEEVRRTLASLAVQGAARPVGKRWIAQARWQEVRDRILAEADAFHKKAPDQIGVERSALRDAAKVDPDLFHEALQELLKESALREEPGGRLARAGHKAQLSGKAAAGASPLEKKFRDAGFAPPSAEEALAACGLSGKEGQAALTLLIQQGTLVRVGEGIVFHREHVDRARVLLVKAAEAQGQVESGKFRDQIKTSRKYVIPLLEYFDAQGLTKRVGNQRFLRKFSR